MLFLYIRSGCYGYKPTMKKMCCPQYTISCHALDFKLSKSQKKAIKRVNNFLNYGTRPSEKPNKDPDQQEGGAVQCLEESPQRPSDLSKQVLTAEDQREPSPKTSNVKESNKPLPSNVQGSEECSTASVIAQNADVKVRKTPKPGETNIFLCSVSN